MAKAEPWMKFHPADWRGDVELRCCSLAGRGFWIECIALMHLSEKYGHLLINGKPPTDTQLAQAIGCTAGEARKGLAEVLENGVAGRTEDGVIYSRRMVRDRAKAEADRSNGSGGGNPLVAGVKGPVKGVVKPPVKGAVNGAVNGRVGLGVNGGVNPQNPDNQTYSSSSESLTPRARGGCLSEHQGVGPTAGALQAVGLGIKFERGGFARIVGAEKKSAGKSAQANQVEAKARLQKILCSLYGLSEMQALQMIDASIDIADPEHHRAREICQRASFDHGCGFYPDRTALPIARQGERA